MNYFRETNNKRVVFLAPTGVSALNVKGQTIHSFFKFKPDITPSKIRKISSPKDIALYNRRDSIVIDEISMVRADLIDGVDKFFRLNRPFRNKSFSVIQMIFIGDIYQLPLVVTGGERSAFTSIYQTPYFYSAKVFDSFVMEFLELEKVYRQKDAKSIVLLNSIRNNSIDEEGLKISNERFIPDFEPPPDDFMSILWGKNEQAERINNRQLEKLRRRIYIFRGYIEDELGKEYLPISIELR